MTAWVYTILSVLGVSLVSLAGVFTLSLKTKKLKKLSDLLVSFAVGALFGDAFIHLMPESFERLGPTLLTSLYIISGIIIFLVLEKFLYWRHCHLPPSREHHHPWITMNLIGDALHNFIDGIVIATTYMISIPVGIATTLAIIFHEIPQELGDFGVLVHGGVSISRALLFNFLSSLIAVLGAITVLFIGPLAKDGLIYLLPIAAGGFIYIAGSDLIPELKHETGVGSSFWQLIALVLGVVAMALLVFIE